MYIDVQLLASVALQSDTQFWTRDKRLAAVAKQLGLGFFRILGGCPVFIVITLLCRVYQHSRQSN